MTAPTLGIVVPCFNETEVLNETVSRLSELLRRMCNDGQISKQSAVYLVDDGSTDNTWPVIQQLCEGSKDVCGIKLSRNRGHQNALFCRSEEHTSELQS